MNRFRFFLNRVLNPLRSRKVRVIVASAIAAYSAAYGWEVSESVVLAILGIGVALAGMIAAEDAALKLSGRSHPGDDASPPNN